MCTPNRTYKMAAECNNCGHHFEADIPKGTPIDKAEVSCPVCEVAPVAIKKPYPVTETPYVPYVPYAPPTRYVWPRWRVWSHGTGDTTNANPPTLTRN